MTLPIEKGSKVLENLVVLVRPTRSDAQQLVNWAVELESVYGATVNSTE